MFGDVQAETAQEVLFKWEQIKKTERKRVAGKASVLDGVPRELPALLRAHRLQKKASRVGFDWTEAREVVKKVEEELAELRAAMESQQPEHVEAELGDLLFSLVNLSRFVAGESRQFESALPHLFFGIVLILWISPLYRSLWIKRKPA